MKAQKDLESFSQSPDCQQQNSKIGNLVCAGISTWFPHIFGTNKSFLVYFWSTVSFSLLFFQQK